MRDVLLRMDPASYAWPAPNLTARMAQSPSAAEAAPTS